MEPCSPPMSETEIVIRGAREHNLKNVSLSLPRNQLIVMTGVSGSGKSSLAFDTLYAEGQRRYIESLSTYARQFLGQLPRPNVDSISGLAPSISIQQKSTSRNPRSTVGTITEIFDYLRVLFARVGQGYCYVSGKPIRAQSTDQIVDSINSQRAGTRFSILAPIVQNQKGEFKELFADLLKRGYLRARVDNEIVSLSDDLRLKRHHKHNIDVVIDRLVAGTGQRARLAEAIEQALKLADGRLICATQKDWTGPPKRGDDSSHDDGSQPHVARNDDDITLAPADRREVQDTLYSVRYSCPESGLSYEPPSPQLFSFNSPIGMCPDCNGLGMRHGIALETMVVDEKKSIRNGALLLLPSLRRMGRWPRHILQGAAAAIEKMVNMDEDSLLKTKWQHVPQEAQNLWLNGTGERHITFKFGHRGGSYKHGGRWEGWTNRLLTDYRSSKNPMRRRQIEKHLEIVACPSCEGERLNRQARHVRIRTNNRRFGKSRAGNELSLPQVCSLTIADAADFFSSLKLDETQQFIAEEALKEIRGRLGFLLQCGLHYLTLDRSAPTLSGGESQRIRLAGQIGCGLVGVVYILDEPSIGLHPRDNGMLLESLQHLRDQGNTVVVVEHDEDTMRAADHIVDFGPGPGIRGGELVASGSFRDLQASQKSLTGKYLSGRLSIAVPDKRRNPTHDAIIVKNARHNNLKGIDVRFPLRRFICVTGVSGSGKSSLINDILWQVLNRDVNRGKGEPGHHKNVTGLQHIDKAIEIDQSPIGRTPRSNPATYVKVFDEIRRLFTQVPQSKMRGYKPGRFSFNVAGGRCEACQGHGATKLEMDFLADIWVPCDVCQGRRFNNETLEVRYRDRNIADVLTMEVRDAVTLFENVPKIQRLLQTLSSVGLDYMQLGQPSPTLSGGEAQRIKLGRELGKRTTGKTLYVLDEPTTGLHFADVHKLLEVLHSFVDAGNTVIVVEHNLDVVKTADWIIDMGPDGGAGGGKVVCEGTPETIARCRTSHTGNALRAVLPRMKARITAKKNLLKTVSTNAFRYSKHIEIRGAAQHNLQEISLRIPRGELAVFCGPSGSGKTSLAMDTLYAEGQRRYVESLSAYARQFLGQMPRPKVESIHGLSPAIAIEQKSVGSTPRSTVGTVTEIYDYLRVLFARLGTVHCPSCGRKAEQQTTDEIVDTILKFPSKTRLLVLAPMEVDRQTPYDTAFQRLRTSGFARVRVDGTTYPLADAPHINHRRAHDVEVVVDRIVVESKSRGRISDSVETALDFGKGVISVAIADTEIDEPEWDTHLYSLHLSCFYCGYSYDRPSPQQFSFNSPLGWCWSCEGLGTEYGENQSLLITSPESSLIDGAIGAWPDPQHNTTFRSLLEGISEEFSIPLDQPWYLLTPEQQRIVLYGDTEHWISVERQQQSFSVRYRGIYPTIELAARLSHSYRQSLVEMSGDRDCSVCSGTRLNETAAAVRLKNVTLPQLTRMPLANAVEFLTTLRLSKAQKQIAGDLLAESMHRLKFLIDVGLAYLTLDRSMPSLSGGESQRIRLAGQVGRSLTGVLYVLDEPTIGLHPRDNGRLLAALRKLRDLGNTVLLVEHDREVLESADRLYDFGPGAGRLGGNVVAQGTPKQLRRQSRKSLTAGYLSGKQSIPVPESRRIQAGRQLSNSGNGAVIRESQPAASRDTVLRRRGKNLSLSKTRRDGEDESTESTHTENPANRSKSSQNTVQHGRAALNLLGATQHNLRNVDLSIPLGTLTCITGVSGSGKSSLVMNTLSRALARRLNLSTDAPGPYRDLLGVEHLSKISIVDQNPIGTTPASNPATYTGVFDHIRELFTQMPDSKVRGYRPGRFSFNRSGGRCDDCEGMGQQKIEMHFLPDVWVECTTCRGKRYNGETLTVKFNGNSIADVLDMPVEKALKHFTNVPKIRATLATLNAIGLGYLRLGQSAPTLSGGEAQRIKLASELSRPNTGRTLYLLDEPTTGLHFDDIRRLLSILNSLVEKGNTVVVIEHNLDVVKTADWVVDMGPEAGSDGGQIVTAGTPEDVVAYAQSAKTRSDLPRSWTGELLASVLQKSKTGTIDVFDIADVTTKRSTDLTLSQLGQAVQLPWEADGQRWHTQECLSHDGKRCRWEGHALQYVVDLLACVPELNPVNWNQRSTVEVKAGGGLGWLLHARTGHEWTLSLCFRVKKHTFDTRTLAAQLDLTPIDDVEEIHYYTDSPRVKVRNLKQPWQEVTVKVWKKKDIDTSGFRTFLKTAVNAYLAQAKKEAANPQDLTPWKQLGRKWHLIKKGLPGNGRVNWPFSTIEKLLPIVESAMDGCKVDYGIRSKINWKFSDGSPAAELHTKRKQSLDFVLFVPSGSVTIGTIADFGLAQNISARRNETDAVQIRFDGVSQVSIEFKHWLESSLL